MNTFTLDGSKEKICLRRDKGSGLSINGRDPQGKLFSVRLAHGDNRRTDKKNLVTPLGRYDYR